LHATRTLAPAPRQTSTSASVQRVQHRALIDRLARWL
jgi:hypothetical protein